MIMKQMPSEVSNLKSVRSHLPGTPGTPGNSTPTSARNNLTAQKAHSIICDPFHNLSIGVHTVCKLELQFHHKTFLISCYNFVISGFCSFYGCIMCLSNKIFSQQILFNFQSFYSQKTVVQLRV